ncbi:MAG TPA: 5'-nucleotidase, lipoprotein e(P4) family [Segetibacter sp.]|jgi:5'-nucleotidase (lipoprotein e(P4) family)
MKGYYCILAFVFFSACSPAKKAVLNSPSSISVQGKMFATLYQQRAAEYTALCYQAYNFARLRVNLWQQQTRPTAIVTDIDETVLDNSLYEAHQTLQGKDYDEKSWKEWTAKGSADTMPGALSFLKYATSKGIEVFYITNRDETERAGTLANLQRFNFPNADNAHLVMKQGTSSKEQRRVNVLKTHSILMLMGDNLADFSALYDKKTSEERTSVTREMSAEFGSKFIVLPNPVYGDWESSLFRYNYKLTDTQKDSTIKSLLKSY